MDIYITVLKTIIFLIIIIFMINICLKFLGKYTNQSRKNFRVVQKIVVSKTSSIGIVQIIDAYYVMSFSENRNEILKELSDYEVTRLLNSLENSKKSENSSKNFKQVLQDMNDKIQELKKRKR
ncbi:flagellar biosynthetic protein FliO [Liquorilactobacillus mali]|uniref:Flagellar biosynthesis protein FliO n=1 Tax=Liquorilactobacillus mali KCTC 3596 = DSM 20444 TaxID=1046596 RepID=J1F661_9LACO|nr:flagellar biosynthetic protein FliO [Liquorilactobacillus mali]AJA34103.1 flagellar protein FliO/FliZ [Liquorilactobacillus mali KCTC 3596 = DSM 20444]EJF02206.1 flagellar biosynthesis protein FliO [Liquorilactobacillus mali KCTC 3596 = DSM 20444]KRN11127.1 flagellar biosynthesis protein FliO [Liquorilactobacillus mali KCTC 3596 = DSM 20444]QFQ75621.1 flagellar biosynthesis protein FliO [Liquorilactobacillus mali]